MKDQNLLYNYQLIDKMRICIRITLLLLVKAHGGEIKVATRENEGSEFIIQLPTN